MAKAASRYLCRFTSSPPHLLTSSVGLRRDRLRRGTSLRDLPLAVLSRESIGHVDFVLLPIRVIVCMLATGKSAVVALLLHLVQGERDGVDASHRVPGHLPEVGRV